MKWLFDWIIGNHWNLPMAIDSGNWKLNPQSQSNVAGKFSKFSSKPCSWLPEGINKVQQEYHLVNVYMAMENNHLY